MDKGLVMTYYDILSVLIQDIILVFVGVGAGGHDNVFSLESNKFKFGTFIFFPVHHLTSSIIKIGVCSLIITVYRSRKLLCDAVLVSSVVRAV